MQDTKTTLWHYTALEGLKGILMSQSLWATDYRYLNDSSELLYSRVLIKDKLYPRILTDVDHDSKGDPNFKELVNSNGGVDKLSDTITENIMDILLKPLFSSETSYPPFILSFCNVKENDHKLMKNGRLSQWRGYGKDGGYALILNKERLIEELRLESEKYYYGITGKGDVRYKIENLNPEDKIKIAFEDVLSQANNFYKFLTIKASEPKISEKEISSIVSCATFLKHYGFSEEEEYRIYVVPFNQKIKEFPGAEKTRPFKRILHREKAGLIIPYVNLFEDCKALPIEAICVGPHKDKQLREQSIKEFVDEMGLSNIRVFSSDIPFVG